MWQRLNCPDAPSQQRTATSRSGVCACLVGVVVVILIVVIVVVAVGIGDAEAGATNTVQRVPRVVRERVANGGARVIGAEIDVTRSPGRMPIVPGPRCPEPSTVPYRLAYQGFLSKARGCDLGTAPPCSTGSSLVGFVTPSLWPGEPW